MSSPTRFGITNRVNTSGVIQNYAGTNHPDVLENAAAPMSNIVYGDRLVLWNTGAQAWPIDVRLDIGLDTARTISAVGLHGFRKAAATSMTDIKIAMQTGAYDGLGTWDYATAPVIPTYASGLEGGPMFERDFGVVFTPKASVTTVRIHCEGVTGPFTLGKVYAGDPFSVASWVGEPGLDLSPQANATNFSYPSGTTFQITLGDNAKPMTIKMSNLTLANMRLLEALKYKGTPFTVIDDQLRFFDCILADMKVGIQRTAPNPLYSVTLNLLGLP